MPDIYPQVASQECTWETQIKKITDHVYQVAVLVCEVRKLTQG